MEGLGYLVYLMNASSKGARLIGSKLVVARYTSGELFTVVPNCLVLPDRYLTGGLYRGILRNTLVSFARQHFGNNYCYQDDNTTPLRARVVPNFLQQGNVTKMKQPVRSLDCNNIKHIWDELGRVCTTCPRILASSAKPCWINGQKCL